MGYLVKNYRYYERIIIDISPLVYYINTTHVFIIRLQNVHKHASHQLETFLELRIYHDIYDNILNILFVSHINSLSHPIPPSLFFPQSKSFIPSLYKSPPFYLLLWLLLVLPDVYIAPDVIRNLFRAYFLAKIYHHVNLNACVTQNIFHSARHI